MSACCGPSRAEVESESIREALDRLRAAGFVPCGECVGLGFRVFGVPEDGEFDAEPCDECLGDGVLGFEAEPVWQAEASWLR